MVRELPAPVTVTFTVPVAALPFTEGEPALTVVVRAVLVSEKSRALPISIGPLMLLVAKFRVTSPGLKIELAASTVVPVTVILPVFTISPFTLRASSEPALIVPRFTVWVSLMVSAPVVNPALIWPKL